MSKKNYYDDFDDYDDYDFDYDCDWDLESDLHNHKNKDRIKWSLTALTFLLVIVLLVGLCLQVFGKGKVQPSEWFADAEEEEAVLMLEPQKSMTAMSLNATRAVASGNSYTLTATVYPSGATNKNVVWSIAWKNPNSSWATGKSVGSYIGLTDSDTSATVTLKTAFGEQAIIKASSESNPDVYATCTVDYVERLSIPHGGGYMDVNRVYQNNNTDQTFAFGTTLNILADVVYSNTGTVRGTVEFGTLNITLGTVIQEYIKSNVSGYNSKYTFKTITKDFTNGLNTSVYFSSPTEFFSFMGNPSDTSSAITNAFIQACHNGGKISFRSTFTYKYGSTTIQSGSVVGDFTVNTNGLAIAATDVNLDDSSLVF